MSHRRQFAWSIALAVAAVVVFFAIMRALYQPTQRRFALTVAPHPAAGRELFESKGCARCHGTDGIGGSAPSLRERASLQSLPRLVTSVWNHIPRMSEAMEASAIAYPSMSSDEMAQLFSYVYINAVTDRPGDPMHGRELFSGKGCATCHADTRAPSVADLGRAQTPLAMAEALWNHASGMSVELERRNLRWPALKAGELRDVFAYVQGGGQSRTGTGDPSRGWELFQKKSCVDCHTLAGRRPVAQLKVATESNDPPPLGTDTLPPTLSEFGETMLNHVPDMRHLMSASHKSPPTFANGELTDIAVFLYSLRYTEPTGSPEIGASVFQWRHCAACHGADASGGAAPALRGRGQNYTAVRLAAGLWRHGAQMYERTQRDHQSWPELQESDIGDLLAFLNTPLDPAH